MENKDIAGFFLEGWYVFDNFAPFQVEWRGKLYPTSEHAYQATKFSETAPELAEQIRLAGSPRLASDIANIHIEKQDPEWKEKRVAIMEEIIRCKLEQHEYVKQTLIDSADRYIVEMNNDDAFWGWGPDHKGQNHLGQIWMKLRSQHLSLFLQSAKS